MSSRLFASAALFLVGTLAHAQGTPADYERAARLSGLTRDKVFRAAVEPNWFAGGTRFWYRVDLPDKAREFLLVDAEAGTRDPAFDHAKLAAALAKAAGRDVSATHLPFDAIEIEKATVRFTAFRKPWAFDAVTGEVSPAPAPPKAEQAPKPHEVRAQPRGPRAENPWTVSVRDHNIFLRKGTEPEFALTKDGTAEDSYSWRDLSWSPDYSKLVALRTRKAEPRVVTIVESSPRTQVQPRVITMPYPKPGDPLPVAKPHLFDVAARKEVPVADELFPNPWELRAPRWLPDGSAFRFVYNQRGHQVLRLVEVDAKTGKARALVSEEPRTFVDYAHKQYRHDVEATNEVIWMSERDGWNHLYLIDGKAGTVKNQITRGEWVVRGVDRVDDEKRQVWFRAGGIHPGQDPYYVHFCRINFDGTGLVKLTDGNGTHSIRYSPDGRYVLDTYSRVDLPPVTELRRADDGRLVRRLERAEVPGLLEIGWQAPEPFAAKGRDGTTDIYGVIWRPTNFDAGKKYPVIEQIYAGPQGSFVPKAFAPFYRAQELAELGFVVVQIDGMGTSNRSKAFHDVCWKDLGDGGFPDRIRWMKAAAAKYPQLDLTRIGVYGGSAGGQNALRAVLAHGDFYKAAAADCGCHDNRMDKVWWNELWMSYPVGPHYAEQSNVTQAYRLTGRLLLTVGEVDRNVDPASTMQVVNALIRAGKDFELVVVPGGGHGAGGMPYGDRRRKDFFVRHLLGVEPPDRNNPPPAPKTEPKKDAPKADAKTAPSVAARKGEPKKAPAVEVPDLAALVAKPAGEVRPLVRMYEADQGGLRRKYGMPTVGGDFGRLFKFYRNWTAAVDQVELASLSNAGVNELAELRTRIKNDWKGLIADAAEAAEIKALVPFAADVAELEEARRKLEPFDRIKLAGRLAAVGRRIDEVRKEVADAKGDKVRGVFLTKALTGRAAAAVAVWRNDLKNWYEFYAGYDPLFTWWVSAPYKEADAALDRYVKALKEKAATRPTEDKDPQGTVIVPPVPAGPSDISDPRALVVRPSEMAAVIQRYQADIQGRGRLPGLSDLSPADRRERQTKQVEGWISALERIDFDKLGRPGQMDYLLLRNALRRDLDRLKQPVADGGGRPRRKDPNEIVGRPIGREALLAALAAEMIPYSPEQLVVMANREYSWCEAEMIKAAREMGLGDNWKAAVEKVKTLHVEPGGQPKLVRDLALEAIDYLRANDLVTVPPLAAETWRMDMMSPERQRFNPFFTGGEVISVAFPTDTMAHEQKLQALRGNNKHFSRATVHHELIPGHHLQQFMTQRYQPQRLAFPTPFWTEGWAVYWEMVLYEKGFPRGPEDRVGLMFWRMHRCARVIFSLGFHLGKMNPQECIDFLVDKVGHERENATAEVRRSFQGGYPPLYQAGYLIGAKQFWALRRELVASGKMTEKAFHDAILKEGILPVELVRVAVTGQKVGRDFAPGWKFAGDLPAAEWPKR